MSTADAQKHKEDEDRTYERIISCKCKVCPLSIFEK